jgi:hypothetical protein
LEEPVASWAFSFEFHKSKKERRKEGKKGEDALQ